MGAQSNGDVDITAALASSLGLSGAANGNANTAGVRSDGVTNCTLGVSDPLCYNGIITISIAAGGFYFPGLTSDSGLQIDFYSVWNMKPMKY
jgi:hypothetical protein